MLTAVSRRRNVSILYEVGVAPCLRTRDEYVNGNCAVIDLELLIAETPNDPPCGPDLAYDHGFMALEQSARGKSEQQFGATLIPAEEPAWGDVRSTAIALLERSKDLRVATLLTRALVHTEGFQGLLPGLQLIRLLLDRYWVAVHPRLDADDYDDPTMRMNALAPLVDSEGLIRDLRNAVLVRSRQHGQMLVRDIEIAHGKLAPRKGAEPVSQRQIEATLSAIAAEEPGILVGVGQTLGAAKALSAFLVDKVGPERAPDFKQLLATLSLLDHVCKAAIPERADTGDTRLAESGVVSIDAEKPMSGEIRTRQDAIEMIDRIISYLERNEPTNPAPLLLKRARRLMGMSFVDIIKDMAPDSLKQIEAIAGRGGDG
jgi:type VI secretion system protein ImpA